MNAMSSRVARPDEVLRVDPVSWPPLSPIGMAPADVREFEELRSALAGAHEELRSARARITELESERAETEAAAHRRGVNDGARAAEQAAQTDKQTMVECISCAIADVATLRSRIRQEAERDLVKLSLAIARRITHRELSVDPEVLLDVVRAALSRVPAGELTKVRLHPAMAATVKFQLEQLKIPS